LARLEGSQNLSSILLKGLGLCDLQGFYPAAVRGSVFCKLLAKQLELCSQASYLLHDRDEV
jgi:hypothetical protein